MYLLQLTEPVKTLLGNGTITSVFLAVMIIALTMFVGWARRLIDTQLKIKDTRIDNLEKSVGELQHSYNTELLTLIGDNHRLMQKSNDTFARLEKLWQEIEEKI